MLAVNFAGVIAAILLLWRAAAADIVGLARLPFALTRWLGKRTFRIYPMAAKASRDQGLGGAPVPADASALGDAPRIRAILTAAAREGRSVSYSELLGDLDHAFARPPKCAVCKTLAEVDRLCAMDGEPDLAVLLVRESDRLPGQGWWVGGTALLLGYDGPWEGAAAARFIREQQQLAFDYSGRGARATAFDRNNTGTRAAASDRFWLFRPLNLFLQALRTCLAGWRKEEIVSVGDLTVKSSAVLLLQPDLAQPLLQIFVGGDRLGIEVGLLRARCSCGSVSIR